MSIQETDDPHNLGEIYIQRCGLYLFICSFLGDDNGCVLDYLSDPQLIYISRL